MLNLLKDLLLKFIINFNKKFPKENTPTVASNPTPHNVNPKPINNIKVEKLDAMTVKLVLSTAIPDSIMATDAEPKAITIEAMANIKDIITTISANPRGNAIGDARIARIINQIDEKLKFLDLSFIEKSFVA